MLKKKLYLRMFDIVDTVFSYERELIICLFLQDFSTGKGSSLHLICNAHTTFLLCAADLSTWHYQDWYWSRNTRDHNLINDTWNEFTNPYADSTTDNKDDDVW